VKSTIKDMMRLGKEVSGLHRVATNHVPMVFPVAEVTETHKTKDGEPKVVENQNKIEYTLDQVLDGIATILAYKNEIESQIMKYNAKHGIPVMVQQIKHHKQMVQSLTGMLNRLASANSNNIRYDEGVEITVTSKAIVEPKQIRKMIQEFNRKAKDLQKEIDKLDAKEIDIDVDEDRLDQIKEMFDSVIATRGSHSMGRGLYG